MSCWTVNSWVLREVPLKGAIQLDDREMEGGHEANMYIKQVTKKVCTLHFTVFKNNYSGLCLSFY
jgi:hypothetical protein